jgi:hypothetical protein
MSLRLIPIHLTGKHCFDTSSAQVEILPLICVFLVTVLHVIWRLPRLACNFALSTLRTLLYSALGSSDTVDEWFQYRVVENIPLDMRTALANFAVEPYFVRYICCPKCCKLYSPDELTKAETLDFAESESESDSEGMPNNVKKPLGSLCTHQETPSSDVCNAPLYHLRFIKGKGFLRPKRTFLYQDFPRWLARFVCRPGIEALLDTPVKALKKEMPDILHDVWDGSIVRDFKDAGGNPFFLYKGPELRLLFSFYYDNFNPFHNRQSGKKYSVGVMFLVCLNLPPNERFKRENMFLVGIVPGPKQPSLTQINHFLKPLVDQLAPFYSSGYFLSQTRQHPRGRTARGGLIPIVTDLHAARQAVGFGSFGSRHFCTFCGLFIQDIEDTDPTNWPARRTCAMHREQAEAWRNAATEAIRLTLFNQTGVRWSEFLRLDYFDPSSFLVFDTMHGWFLNAFENHIRTIFGISLEKESGDGLFVSPRPAGPRATPQECLKALNFIQEKRYSELEKMDRFILYDLCAYRNLRRADGRPRMCLSLRTYYVCLKHWSYLTSLSLEQESCQAQLSADIHYWNIRNKGASNRKDKLKTARERILNSSEETQEEDLVYLSRRTKEDLQTLCRENSITISSHWTKDRLASELLGAGRDTVALTNYVYPRQASVLGFEIVEQIDADIARTVLPTWLAATPLKFGSSDHGTLKAEEWRTVALVRLVVTLPRVWGFGTARQSLMLDNYMHLVSAIIVGNSRVIIRTPSAQRGLTKSTAQLYQYHFQAYLQGVVELYPTAKIKPNMHLCYHVGDLLPFFGPVHPWRCNVCERYIGMLQDIPMNMRFGMLKLIIHSYVYKFCR